VRVYQPQRHRVDRRMRRRPVAPLDEQDTQGARAQRVHPRQELDRDLARQPFVHDRQRYLLAVRQQSGQHVQGVLGRGGDASVVRPESSFDVVDKGGTDVILVADNQQHRSDSHPAHLHSDPSWRDSLGVRASCVISLGGSSDWRG
jgi:hypothetical protein